MVDINISYNNRRRSLGNANAVVQEVASDFLCEKIGVLLIDLIQVQFSASTLNRLKVHYGYIVSPLILLQYLVAIYWIDRRKVGFSRSILCFTYLANCS